MRQLAFLVLDLVRLFDEKGGVEVPEDRFIMDRKV
jgi:hypothetical protein